MKMLKIVFLLLFMVFLPQQMMAEDTNLVTKVTVSKSSVSVGDMVTYTVIVTNKGPVDATDVLVGNILSKSIEQAKYTPSQGSVEAPTLGVEEKPTIWSIGTIENGKSVTLTMEGKVGDGTQGGKISNIVSDVNCSQNDTDTAEDNYIATLTVNLDPVEDLCSAGFNWDNSGWADGELSKTITLDNNVTADILIKTDSSGTFTDKGKETPFIDSINVVDNNDRSIHVFGGVSDLGVVFNPDNNTGTSPVTITITFSKKIYNSSFLITDIDASGSDRDDKVTVTSDVGTPKLTVLNKSTPTATLTADNSAESTHDISSFDDNQGTVRITIPDGSKKITILYEEANTKVTDHPGRGIGFLGNLSTCKAASISGSVKDDNGVNLTNVTITLKDSNGATVETTTTNEEGIYSFSDIVPGDYTVVETNPTGYISISDGDTSKSDDDTLNTNTNDDSIPVSVVAGEIDDENNFVDKKSTEARAVDDKAKGVSGKPTEVNVVANDNLVDPTTVKIKDGSNLVTELVVPNEGKWRVDPTTGAITFTPETGFTGDPTPITYVVNDTNGNEVAPATVTVNYSGTNPTKLDSDGDGIPDDEDLDDDNDGILDTVEEHGTPDLDTDGDGVPDRLDLDSDNDGILDLLESGQDVATVDANNDGRLDSTTDLDKDGVMDTADADDNDKDSVGTVTPRDTDGDGKRDFQDVDSDNDGLSDLVEAGVPVSNDEDNDGMIDGGVDANGIPTVTPSIANPLDSDNDGRADYRELDSDNDGKKDIVEAGAEDTDNNGLVDNEGTLVDVSHLPDTNANGVADYREPPSVLDGDSTECCDCDYDENSVAIYNNGTLLLVLLLGSLFGVFLFRKEKF